MARPPFRIEPATTIDEFSRAAQLFRAYAASLDVDLCFQGFDHEVATLPGRYAAPGGVILLARDADDAPLGCVALRPFEPPDVCEMKRLFLVNAARGHGLRRGLVEAIVAAGRQLGYRQMRLDTLPAMDVAARLYARAGFRPVPPTGPSPLEGLLFFARTL